MRKKLHPRAGYINENEFQLKTNKYPRTNLRLIAHGGVNLRIFARSSRSFGSSEQENKISLGRPETIGSSE